MEDGWVIPIIQDNFLYNSSPWLLVSGNITLQDIEVDLAIGLKVSEPTILSEEKKTKFSSKNQSATVKQGQLENVAFCQGPVTERNSLLREHLKRLTGHLVDIIF